MYITMYGVVTVGAVSTTFHAFFNNVIDAQLYLDADDRKDRFWNAEIRKFQMGDIREVQ